MSIKKTLEAARAKIALPENWIKGEFGYNKAYSQPIEPWSKHANCWCIRGSIYAASGGWVSKDAASAMSHVERILLKYTGWPERLLANWNDDPATTHNDVIGLLDRAIAEAPDD